MDGNCLYKQGRGIKRRRISETMKKVIYIYNKDFTIRDFHRYGMDYLISKGYDVDVTVMFEPKTEVVRDFRPSIGLYDGDHLVRVEQKEFPQYVKKNPGAIFIIVGFDLLWLKRLRLLKKYGCKYIVLGSLSLMYTEPIQDKSGHEHKNESFLRRHLGALQHYGLKAFIRIENDNLYRKLIEHGGAASKFLLRDIDPAYAVIKATANSTAAIPKQLIDRVEVLHATDYDRYIEFQRAGKQVTEEFIVYVDSGWTAMDEDAILAKNDVRPYDVKTVNKNICKVFDLLEAHSHMPVIVAGHPHTCYEGNEFGNRKIFLNQTENLIPKAKFVILQMSVAVNMVVLFHKDMMAIEWDGFEKIGPSYQAYYKACWDFFGMASCNVDNEKENKHPWDFVKHADLNKYEEYKKRFICERDNNELLAECIEELDTQAQVG